MNTFLIIGLILAFLILVILRIRSKKRKNKLEKVLSESHISTEERISENNYSQQPANSLTSQDFPEDLMEVVNKIVAIPRDFNEFVNKSKYQLVIESGYMDKHEQITMRQLHMF